ncbi:MAG: hypothetical protein ACTTJH_08270 [Bacteroidales bacterium]
MKKVNWKKIIEFAIVILTALSGFISGQAAAQTGLIDLFSKYC